MENEDIKLKIIALIDKIRPYLINDGGNLEFVDYKDNIVYVRLMGACKDCSCCELAWAQMPYEAEEGGAK